MKPKSVKPCGKCLTPYGAYAQTTAILPSRFDGRKFGYAERICYECMCDLEYSRSKKSKKVIKLEKELHEVVLRYEKSVRRIAAKFARTNKGMFEELYQEAFISLIKLVNSKDISNEKFSHLVSKAIRRSLIDFVRRRTGFRNPHYRQTLTNIYEHSGVTPGLEWAEDSIDTVKGLARFLPPFEREVIILHYCYGYELNEIATLKSVHLQKINRTHVNALRMLRESQKIPKSPIARILRSLVESSE